MGDCIKGLTEVQADGILSLSLVLVKLGGFSRSKAKFFRETKNGRKRRKIQYSFLAFCLDVGDSCGVLSPV